MSLVDKIFSSLGLNKREERKYVPPTAPETQAAQETPKIEVQISDFNSNYNKHMLYYARMIREGHPEDEASYLAHRDCPIVRIDSQLRI